MSSPALVTVQLTPADAALIAKLLANHAEALLFTAPFYRLHELPTLAAATERDAFLANKLASHIDLACEVSRG